MLGTPGGDVGDTSAHHGRQCQALVPLGVGVLLQDPGVELEGRDGKRGKVGVIPGKRLLAQFMELGRLRFPKIRLQLP